MKFNISEIDGPIAIKFYLKHHLGWKKAALEFDIDQIRSLILEVLVLGAGFWVLIVSVPDLCIPFTSMAKDSSHGVLMGKML